MKLDDFQSAAGAGLRDAAASVIAPDLATVMKQRRLRLVAGAVIGSFVVTLSIGILVLQLGPGGDAVPDQPTPIATMPSTTASPTPSTTPERAGSTTVAPGLPDEVTRFASDCPAAAPMVSGGADGLPRKGSTDEDQVRRQLGPARDRLMDDNPNIVDVRVIQRRGQVWSGPNNGIYSIEEALDYQFEAVLAEDAPCPDVPLFISGIPVVFNRVSHQRVAGFDNVPLDARGGHSVVWTGTEMIVWGGWGDEMGTIRYDDGAAYDPTTDTWRRIARAPIDGREYHNAVWTGDEMLVFGSGSLPVASGAAYDPDADTWRELPEAPFGVGSAEFGRAGWAWDGTLLIVWDVRDDRVAAYSPADDRWDEWSPIGIPGVSGALRWDGSDVYALSVEAWITAGDLRVRRFDGDGWEELATATPPEFSPEGYWIAPDPRLTAAVGGLIVAWTDSGSEANTLAFDPGSGVWQQIDSVPISASEGVPAPIVAGDRIVAFGYGTSGVFDPKTRSWSTLAIPYGSAQISVWTGGEIITWGDPCCYGSGGEPFDVRSWRARLNP